MLFPPRSLDGSPQLTLELDTRGDLLPRILWAGVATPATAVAGGYPSTFRGPGVPLLGEHAHELFTRPHLIGHRVDAPGSDAAWSTRFVVDEVVEADDRLEVRASDATAGLGLFVELEALPGGLLRARHTITSTGPGNYHLAALDVVLPATDDLVELLDFTGRHEGERTPQRHSITDGLWVREGREGRPGLGGTTIAVIGTSGFDTCTGTVLGVHVAWSGNSSFRVERSPDLGATIGGGELLHFADADGDGMGDLRGIIDHLDHLADLGVDVHLAVADLPVAAGRQRLRHQRLPGHRPALRQPGRPSTSCSRAARPRHEADHGPGRQPQLRRAPVVRRDPLGAGQPEAGLVLVAAAARGHGAGPPGAEPTNWGARLRRLGLGVRPGRPASTTCTCSRRKQPDLNWENPRGPGGRLRDDALVAGPRRRRLPDGRHQHDLQACPPPPTVAAAGRRVRRRLGRVHQRAAHPRVPARDARAGLRRPRRADRSARCPA